MKIFLAIIIPFSIIKCLSASVAIAESKLRNYFIFYNRKTFSCFYSHFRSSSIYKCYRSVSLNQKIFKLQKPNSTNVPFAIDLVACCPSGNNCKASCGNLTSQTFTLKGDNYITKGYRNPFSILFNSTNGLFLFQYQGFCMRTYNQNYYNYHYSYSCLDLIDRKLVENEWIGVIATNFTPVKTNITGNSKNLKITWEYRKKVTYFIGNRSNSLLSNCSSSNSSSPIKFTNNGSHISTILDISNLHKCGFHNYYYNSQLYGYVMEFYHLRNEIHYHYVVLSFYSNAILNFNVVTNGSTKDLSSHSKGNTAYFRSILFPKVQFVSSNGGGNSTLLKGTHASFKFDFSNYTLPIYTMSGYNQRLVNVDTLESYYPPLSFTKINSSVFIMNLNFSIVSKSGNYFFNASLQIYPGSSRRILEEENKESEYGMDISKKFTIEVEGDNQKIVTNPKSGNKINLILVIIICVITLLLIATIVAFVMKNRKRNYESAKNIEKMVSTTI